MKIAINAGHWLGTEGRRCTAAFDPAKTQEWVLNARVCEELEKLLTSYSGVEILRVDDRRGAIGIDNDARCDAANKWGADLWLGIHHNAGINGGSGGGIVVYAERQPDETEKALQSEIYNSLIKHTALKGNRATPLASKDFNELAWARCPALLLELGFMDSSTDTPIIVTEAFDEACAIGIAEAVATHYGLKKAPQGIISTDAHVSVDCPAWSAFNKTFRTGTVFTEDDIEFLGIRGSMACVLYPTATSVKAAWIEAKNIKGE